MNKLKLSKSNHYNLEYNHTSCNLYVNVGTGKLGLVYPITTLGQNSFSLPISLVYNSQYESLPLDNITFNNGFKLNLHQYIKKYEETFNLNNFTVGDYVYIDEMYNIHRFIKYKEENNKEIYYDKDNALLTLQKEENSFILKNEYTNQKYYFNNDGTLVEIEDLKNSNIKKKLVYQDNKLIKVYDQRDTSKTIDFIYDSNGKLVHIVHSKENRFFTFLYQQSYLENILIQSEDNTLDCTTFNYNSNLLLEDINSNLDKTTIKVEYILNENLYKVKSVKEGALKKICITEDSGLYLGDDIYLNDDSYITDLTTKRVKSKYYEMTPENINQLTELLYLEKATEVTNNNVCIRYYLKEEKEILSAFEVNYEGLFSLEKIVGWSISDDQEYYQGINGNNSVVLDSSNNYTYEVDSSDLENFKSIFTTKNEQKIYEEKYSKNFYISLFLKYIKNNHSNNLVTVSYELNSKEYIKKVRVEEMEKEIWQKVLIPLELNTEAKTLNNIKIKVEGCINETEVVLSNIKIIRGNSSFIYLDNNDSSEDTKLTFGYPFLTGDLLFPFDSSFYMTDSDLLNTSKNIYLKKVNNKTSYDLIYNNNTKRKDVLFSSIVLNEENIPNYYLKEIIQTSDDTYVVKNTMYRFFYDGSISKHCVEVKTILKENANSSDTQKRLIEEGNIVNKVYYTLDNLFIKSIDNEKIVYEKVYDSYSNILKEKIYNLNNNEEVIEKEYIYKGETEEIKELLNTYKENGKEVQYVYDTNNILKQVIVDNITYEYVYDLNNNLEEAIVDNITYQYAYAKLNNLPLAVSIKDQSQNEEKVNIYYNKNGSIKYFDNEKDSVYGFIYGIYNDLNRVYKDKQLLLEQYIKKEDSNIKSISKLYQDKDKVYQTEQQYNNYKKLEKITDGQSITNIIYEDIDDEETKLNKRAVRIEDGYTNEVHTITYEDLKLNPSVKEELENKIQITKYQNNLVEYEIEEDEFKTTHQFKNINSLDKKPLYSTITKITDNKEEVIPDYTYEYLYDDLGRMTKKQSFALTIEGKKAEGEENFKFIEKEIEYVPSTTIPSTIKSKIVYGNHDSNYYSKNTNYNHTYYDSGNIKEIEEVKTNLVNTLLDIQSYFPSFPQELVFRDQVNKKTYEYDNFNRLTKESIYEDGDLIDVINYTYDESGMLSLITKNNEIVKEFINENGRLTQVDNSDIINYDKYGNILNTNKYNFTYNSRNLLETFTQKNNTQSNNLQGIYTYNYQGVRSKKEIKSVNTNQLLKTVNYYLDGNKIIGEDIVYNSNNNEIKKLRYFYDLEGIIGIYYSGSYYSLLKDSIGNIKGIVHNGLLIGEYEYDAWGNHTIRSYINNDSSNINKEDEEFILNNNPFRYKGYYYDVETNLFLVSSRYYSPELCRWISPDDIEYLDPESVNGLNLYCYCFNDPVNYVDPDGHFPVLAAILCGLAIVGMGLTIGGVASDNNTMTAIGLTMVAIPALISGGMALYCAGAVGTMLIGGVTVFAGIGTGVFASAEYQEAFTGNNWIIDTTGMSEGFYNGLMLATAAIATAGTAASMAGVTRYQNFGNKNWHGGWKKMRSHYLKHGKPEMGYRSVFDYTNGANSIINNGGVYLSNANSYAQWIAGNKYFYVGVGRGSNLITTYSIRTIKYAKYLSLL